MLKKVSVMVATGGPVGAGPLGALVYSLLALPVLVLFNGVHYFSVQLAWAILLIVSAAAVISILAIRSTEYESVIVVDKVLGMICALLFIPWSLKVIAVGFALFHVMRFVLPIVCKVFFSFDVKQKLGYASVVVPSVLTGVLVNIVLRFALWLAR